MDETLNYVQYIYLGEMSALYIINIIEGNVRDENSVDVNVRPKNFPVQIYSLSFMRLNIYALHLLLIQM